MEITLHILTKIVLLTVFCMLNINCETLRKNSQNKPDSLPRWDAQGYVFFCLCMGRFGNQVDHFLGGMAFAKAINRTLVVPPFRTYRNVKFTEWFKLEPIQQYHKAVLAEDFMKHLAPTHWPQRDRIGFCWKPEKEQNTDCNMKEGNPFGPFWEGLGVNFEKSITYQISYYESEVDNWKEQFPPEKYPVLAFRGAPAHFPVFSHHRHLQKHLEISDRIQNEAQQYIDKHFPNKKFVGIHLRNGPDWLNACTGAENVPFYMASPQCLDGTGKTVTKLLCYPDEAEVLRMTKKAVIETGVNVVFIATDKYPMIDQLEKHLQDQKVAVYHADPHLPLVDLTILIKSELFIGNCVSSFTSFAKRARDIENKSTWFFGFS